MRRLLMLIVLLGMGFAAAHADDRSDLEKQLRRNYEGKVLILRTFYDGPELRFDSAGNKLQGGDPGPWTLDAEVQVEKLRLSTDKLEIEGKRLFLVYDEKSKQFEDALLWVDANLEGDRKKTSRDSLHQRQPVHIALDLPEGGLTEQVLTTALHRVFLAPEEALADFVPGYWRNVVVRIFGGPPLPPGRVGGGVFRVGGGVSAPRATFQPDPEYTDIARAAGLQGTVVLWVIVGPGGDVREVSIEKPLGLGLDDKSVAAVQTWKFRPALKGDQPVAVAVRIETNFHLY